MNDQLAATTPQLIRMIVIIVAFISIVCLRRHPRLEGFWARIVKQWQTATILTLIYLVAVSVSITAFETEPHRILVSIVTNGAYIFCLTMLGLGFAANIVGFEPFRLRRGAKGIPSIFMGMLILFALFGLKKFTVSQGLIALGITGPPETTSGLEFFQEFSLVQIFFMLLMGAGIAEEVFFRLFIMTGLWCLLKRSSLAIVFSAILFGLYHLSPLDNLYLTFWEYPVHKFITTFLFGLGAAWIYSKKGLEAPIIAHTFWDFTGAVVMKLSL